MKMHKFNVGRLIVISQQIFGVCGVDGEFWNIIERIPL